VFVKICGVTSEEDALLAVAMGADAVGFVFAPSSRQIAPQKAADIAKRLPAEIVTVGVFRDETRQRVVDVVHGAGLRVAQLHGHETPATTRWIRARVPLVFKAFVAGDVLLSQAADHGADAVLVDSKVPGSGEVFDWSLAEAAPADRKVILAGGLTPQNVAEAVRHVRPWGVDVSTGVESAPGRKDARKLRSFIYEARIAESNSPPIGPASGPSRARANGHGLRPAGPPAAGSGQAAPADRSGRSRNRPFDWMADDPS
jgi:phosphoribosylanthranilate isomerase